MKAEDTPRLAKLLAVLGEAFNRQISQATAKAYFLALNDLEIEDIEHAAVEHLKTGKFFPRPAELREIARPRDNPEDRAALAWEKTWPLVHSVGSYRTPDIEDPVASHVIKSMGGWVAFCLPTDEERWHRKRFMDLYAALDGRRDALEPSRLLGHHDLQNARRGILGRQNGKPEAGPGDNAS